MWCKGKREKSIIRELLLGIATPFESWQLHRLLRLNCVKLTRGNTMGLELHARKWLFTHHNRLSCAKLTRNVTRLGSASRTCENAGIALRASRPTYSWHFSKEMLILIDSATNLLTRGTKRPAMQRKKLENVWRQLLDDVFTLLLTLHSALDHGVAISLAKIRGVESLAR